MDIAHGELEPIRPTILLVEDDHGVRRSLQLLLQGQGYNVKAYFEGHPLLGDEQSLSAACLITDYRMADMDGFAVLDAMRALGWNGPSILITAFPSAALAQRAKTAGFNMVMEKPLKPHALVGLVEQLVPIP